MMCEQYSFVRDEFRLFLSDAIQFIGSNDVEFRHGLAKETPRLGFSGAQKVTMFTLVGSRANHTHSSYSINCHQVCE